MKKAKKNPQKLREVNLNLFAIYIHNCSTKRGEKTFLHLNLFSKQLSLRHYHVGELPTIYSLTTSRKL